MTNAAILAAVAATNLAVRLPQVVVYASRIGDTAADLPSSVQVMDDADIAASGALDLPELLERGAGIAIHRLNANPLQSEISMRGFGENSFGRTKVILDGEELNNVDMFAPNLMRAPLAGLERVEVLRGPQPVLYGDGAVAGVVNAVSDEADDEGKTRISATGGSYGTFGASAMTRGGADDGITYSSALDYLRSDGWRDRGGYNLETASAGVRKNYEGGSSLALRANVQHARYELPGSIPLEGWREHPRDAAYLNDWSRLWSGGLTLDSKIAMQDEQEFRIDAGASRQTRRSHWGDYFYENDYRLWGLFLSPRYISERDAFGLGSKFTVGADIRYDRDDIRDRSGFNNPKYHFSRTRAAAFVHEQLWATEQIAIVAGARAESIANRWNNYSGLTDDDSHDWEGDWELGLVWHPTDAIKAFAKGTRFHRSPFCDEMNYTLDGKLLKPETGHSFDIGFDWQATSELSIDAVAYTMCMEDEIFYNPYAIESPWGWGGYNCNSPAKTRRAGIDAGLNWRREGVADASLRYGLVNAYFHGGQYDDCDIPRVPQHRVSTEAGLWLTEELKLRVGHRFTSSQRLVGDFANDHGKIGAYSVFDAGATYEPNWAKGWRLSLVVDNLLDRRYCDFAGWSDFSGAYCYPAAGRSILATLSCEF